MIQKLALSLFAIALTTAAAAVERPALRSEAVVTDSVVRIGDLIANAGIVANVPIFRAPPLGQSGSISAAQVLEAVRAHALVGLDPGPVSDVTVTRASRAIEPNEIETLIATTLAKSYGLGNRADISVTFDRPLRTLHFEPTMLGAPHIDQLRYDARTGRFHGALTISGAPSIALRLAGTAVLTAEVVELLRPLARGEVIKLSDLTLRRIPRAAITAETIADVDHAVGLAARSTINAGRPIRASELTKPQVVQRNDNVTIVYQVPGLMLAVRGKANDGGAEGDMIDVVNLQSNRTVRGTILGSGQVAVAPMVARLIASAEPPSNSSRRFGAK